MMMMTTFYSQVQRMVNKNVTNNCIFKLSLNYRDFVMVKCNWSCMQTQQWYDFRLTWNADDYGGVRRLYVPSNELWLPDIVLYNRCALCCFLMVMAKKIS